MRRTNVYLTETQVERLRAQAEKEGVTQAELLRRAVDAFLMWNDPNYAPSPSRPDRNKLVSPS